MLLKTLVYCVGLRVAILLFVVRLSILGHRLDESNANIRRNRIDDNAGIYFSDSLQNDAEGSATGSDNEDDLDETASGKGFDDEDSKDIIDNGGSGDKDSDNIDEDVDGSGDESAVLMPSSTEMPTKKTTTTKKATTPYKEKDSSKTTKTTKVVPNDNKLPDIAFPAATTPETSTRFSAPSSTPKHDKDSDRSDDNNSLSNEVSILGRRADNTASFFARPGILAAVIGGAVVGLLCAILLVMFIVYRMRKKDEGSYALDEPKRATAVNPYARGASKEFYA